MKKEDINYGLEELDHSQYEAMRLVGQLENFNECGFINDKLHEFLHDRISEICERLDTVRLYII